MVKNDLLVLTQNAATKENVQNTFRRLWTNTDLSDVTLATEDGSQIKAHKVILASTSVFFENLFKRTNHPNILVYLKGVTKSRLEMLLKFVYLSQVEVPAEDLEGFLDVGRELQISGLVDNVGFSEKERVIPLTPEPTNQANTKGKIDSFEKHGGSFQSTSNYVQSLDGAKETLFPKRSRENDIGGKLTKQKEPGERENDDPNSFDESFSNLNTLKAKKKKKRRVLKPNSQKIKDFPVTSVTGCMQAKPLYTATKDIFTRELTSWRTALIKRGINSLEPRALRIDKCKMQQNRNERRTLCVISVTWPLREHLIFSSTKRQNMVEVFMLAISVTMNQHRRKIWRDTRKESILEEKKRSFLTLTTVKISTVVTTGALIFPNCPNCTTTKKLSTLELCTLVNIVIIKPHSWKI